MTTVQTLKEIGDEMEFERHWLEGLRVTEAREREERNKQREHNKEHQEKEERFKLQQMEYEKQKQQ